MGGLLKEVVKFLEKRFYHRREEVLSEGPLLCGLCGHFGYYDVPFFLRGLGQEIMSNIVSNFLYVQYFTIIRYVSSDRSESHIHCKLYIIIDIVEDP